MITHFPGQKEGIICVNLFRVVESLAHDSCGFESLAFLCAEAIQIA